MARPFFSTIIPTLNEEKYLSLLLATKTKALPHSFAAHPDPGVHLFSLETTFTNSI